MRTRLRSRVGDRVMGGRHDGSPVGSCQLRGGMEAAPLWADGSWQLPTSHFVSRYAIGPRSLRCINPFSIDRQRKSAHTYAKSSPIRGSPLMTDLALTAASARGSEAAPSLDGLIAENAKALSSQLHTLRARLFPPSAQKQLRSFTSAEAARTHWCYRRVLTAARVSRRWA